MMKAIVTMVALFSLATTASAVPPPFAVCVITDDANGYARLDSYHSEIEPARERRAEIVASGWITDRPLPGMEQTQGDREYEYNETSVVKAFVDPTLVNESACMAPETASEANDTPVSR